MRQVTIDAKDVAPIDLRRYWRTDKVTKEKQCIIALAFNQQDIRLEIGDCVSMAVTTSKEPIKLIVVEDENEVLAVLVKGFDDDKEETETHGISETDLS